LRVVEVFPMDVVLAKSHRLCALVHKMVMRIVLDLKRPELPLPFV